jgi:hypothetical protein
VGSWQHAPGSALVCGGIFPVPRYGSLPAFLFAAFSHGLVAACLKEADFMAAHQIRVHLGAMRHP